MKRLPLVRWRQARQRLAVAIVALSLSACATPPQPKLPTPPEPPPPPPPTVQVEPLKRQSQPQPVSGSPQQGDEASSGEGKQQQDGEALAGADATERGATDGTEQKDKMSGEGGASGAVSAAPGAVVGDPAVAGTAPASGVVGQNTGLDGQLDRELSKFDEALLADQKSLAMRREQAHADGGSGIGGEDQWPEGYGDSGEDSSARGSASESGEREQGEAQGQQGGVARTSERRADGTRVEQIPDGRDDDIVARQLREAAEGETDPELREKLWQEYRDYKKSVSRQAGS